MPERNVQAADVKHSWRGVDQRSVPTLTQEGFCTFSKGVFFGLGNNAERISGKKLSGLIELPIFGVWQFGSNVLVQTISDVRMITVAELVTLQGTFNERILGEDGSPIQAEDNQYLEMDL